MLSLPNDLVIALLSLPDTFSELLFLLNVDEQSFAVFELRACLLSSLNDAVIVLFSSVCTIVIIYDKYHRAAAYVFCSIALLRSDVVQVRELII